jgi:hypothetical protein
MIDLWLWLTFLAHHTKQLYLFQRIEHLICLEHCGWRDWDQAGYSLQENPGDRNNAYASSALSSSVEVIMWESWVWVGAVERLPEGSKFEHDLEEGQRKHQKAFWWVCCVSSTLLGLDRKGGGVTRRRHCVVSCLSQSLPEGPCSLGCFLFSFFFFH